MVPAAHHGARAQPAGRARGSHGRRTSSARERATWRSPAVRGRALLEAAAGERADFLPSMKFRIAVGDIAWLGRSAGPTRT